MCNISSWPVSADLHISYHISVGAIYFISAGMCGGRAEVFGLTCTLWISPIPCIQPCFLYDSGPEDDWEYCKE